MNIHFSFQRKFIKLQQEMLANLLVTRFSHNIQRYEVLFLSYTYSVEKNVHATRIK